jgi:hypothetical protein
LAPIASPRVEEHVDDDHRRAVRVAHDAYLDVARAGAALAEPRRQLLGGLEQAGAGGPDALDRGAGIGDVDELDLADHRARIRFGDEAAARAREQRGVRRGRDDRRLLDDHGDDDVAAVHLEVEGDAERQRERADGVLDHGVRDLEGKPVAVAERVHLRAGQVHRLGDLPPPLLHAQPIERRDPRAAHAPPSALTQAVS